jgi:hypothetical protein
MVGDMARLRGEHSPSRFLSIRAVYRQVAAGEGPIPDRPGRGGSTA